LWGKYDGLLLVDVPATDEAVFGMKWASLEISQFKVRQEEAAKCTKSILERQRWPEGVRIYCNVAEKDEQKMEELRMRMSRGLDLMQVREDSGIETTSSTLPLSLLGYALMKMWRDITLTHFLHCSTDSHGLSSKIRWHLL
jgi:hypothetical protein